MLPISSKCLSAELSLEEEDDEEEDEEVKGLCRFPLKEGQVGFSFLLGHGVEGHWEW